MLKKVIFILAITSLIAVANEEEVKKPKYRQNWWSLGAGLVFTEIPISESDFQVIMADVYYQSVFYESSPKLRLCASLGVYGFGLLLPVPKIGIQTYFRERSENLQFKLGMNGFYDISVGGHGGVALELGVLYQDRFEVTFMTVPAGTDSKRDYLEFIGVRDKEGSKPFVVLPYFGIFLSMRL